MLPKKNRADRKTIENIFKKGQFLKSPSLNFKFIPAGSKNISFIVPKSVAKSAVKRNLLRRRGYAAVSKNFNIIPPRISGAFILKSSDVSVSELEKEIKNILEKVK